MKLENPVVSLIEQMYQARHEIAEAYDLGEVDITSCNQKYVEPLLKNNLVSKTSHNYVRLETSFRRLFDMALNKEGLILLDSDLGSEVEAMDVEFSHLIEHESLDNHTESQQTEKSLRDRLYSIYDNLVFTATQLQNKIDLGFGVSDSHSIRLLENQYHFTLLKRLIESFDKVRTEFGQEKFQDHPVMSGLTHNIEVKCLGVIGRLQQIQEVISENIFHHRALEEGALKIRALNKFLKAHSSHYLEKSEASAYKHSYFSRATPVLVCPFPDISNNAHEDTLNEIVTSIQRRIKIESTQAVRDKSSLDRSDIIVEALVTPPCEIQARRLIKEVHKTKKPISVSLFYNKICEEQDQDDESINKNYWLYYLLNYFQPEKRFGGKLLSRYIKCHPILIQNASFNGNYDLRDLVVYPSKINDEILYSYIQEVGTFE